MTMDDLVFGIIVLLAIVLLVGWLLVEFKDKNRWLRVTSSLVFTSFVCTYLLLIIVNQNVIRSKGVYLHKGNVRQMENVIKAGKSTELIPILEHYREDLNKSAYSAQFDLSDELEILLEDEDTRLFAEDP